MLESYFKDSQQSIGRMADSSNLAGTLKAIFYIPSQLSMQHDFKSGSNGHCG